MRVRDLQAAKQMAIGSETVRRGTGVSPIVLGTGDTETISQPIKLLWIDRMDAETAIQKHIHDRPMWHLDRNRDRACRTRNGLNPIGQLRKPGAAMPKFAFAHDTTIGIENADLMFLGTPIHGGKPLEGLLTHLSLLSLTREPPRRLSTLYERSKARLPTGHSSWPTRRGTSPISVLEARGGRW
jgi:hypothetical protein